MTKESMSTEVIKFERLRHTQQQDKDPRGAKSQSGRHMHKIDN